jgi:hypothetical protein
MTVAELRARLTVEEEAAWVEYHTMLAEEQKQRLAEMKRSGPRYNRVRR